MRLIDADKLPIKFDGHIVSVWKNDLDAAPTINPYEWIDVKDRLPNKNGEYLCYVTSSYGSGMAIYKFALNLEQVYKDDFRDKKHCGWYTYASEYGYVETKAVTHWMPLPTPPTEKEN